MAASPPSVAGVLSPASPPRLSCSDVERKEIEALKARVTDAAAKLPLSPIGDRWRSDGMLLRFIRARKHDLAAAEAMYRDVVQWRDQVGANDVLRSYSEPGVMSRYYPGGLHGVDRDGNALLFERLGVMDMRGLMESIGEADFLKWVIFHHERQEMHMAELSAAAGECKIGLTVITDMHGMSVRHMSPAIFGLMQKRTRLELDHYPETAKRVFIIRAPKLFASVYNLLKPMLDEGTRDKIFVLGSDYMSTLEKYIDPIHIPRALGGLCACEGDPECKSKIKPGGKVPALYKSKAPSENEVIDVPNRHSITTHLLLEAGSKVTWNFKVGGNHHINFFLFTCDAGTTTAFEGLDVKNLATVPAGYDTVVAPLRVKEGRGEYVAPRDCHAFLVWDNSVSWFHNHTVMRNVDVIEAGDAPAAAASMPLELPAPEVPEPVPQAAVAGGAGSEPPVLPSSSASSSSPSSS